MKKNRNSSKESGNGIETAVPQSGGTRTGSSVTRGEEPAGHFRQDEILVLEERLKKLQKEYSLVLRNLSQARRSYEGLLKKCETIKLLLASYYNLEAGVAGQVLVPERGTPYWYVRATFGRSYFDVCQCEWNGGISDKFRFCRGNFFLEEQAANLVCSSCNELMSRL